MECKKKPVVVETDVISLKLREVLILDKQSLARGHLFVVKVLTTSRNQAKRKLCNKCEKVKMADTCNYISGDLLCALLPLFVDGILRSKKKKKFSK